ncbi:AraC family transcriptional regulator [Tenacibaculum maritimum]|uniref:AraC family transcriptional regulator n=1 Tax=Tenacibaculum maritimum TaxID=107401 RepID=UPI003876633E
MTVAPEELKNKHSFTVEKRKFHLVNYISSEEKNYKITLTEHAIVYVFDGTKTVSINNVSHTIERGQLFMLPKGVYIMSEYLPDTQKAFKSIMLFFNHYHIADMISHLEQPIDTTGHHSIRIIKNNINIAHFYQSLEKINWNTHDFSKEYLDLKIKELIYILLADPTTKSTAISFLYSVYNTNKRTISSVINDHLYKKITVNTLAKMCNMSVSTFKREFAKEFKASPMQWIHLKKLEKAFLLVKNTSQRISDIAYECGFESYAHFSKSFKSKFGKSPSEIRTNLK